MTKLRAIVLDTAARKIRFETAVKLGIPTGSGRVVHIGDQSAILRSGQTYVRDPSFPVVLVLGIAVLVFGAFVGGIAFLLLGPVGLGGGGIIITVGITLTFMGLSRWRSFTYFLMREGDPRPLTFITREIPTTVEEIDAYQASGKDPPKKSQVLRVDETLGPSPYDAQMFHEAIKSDIATRFMRPAMDAKRIILYVVLALVVLGVIAALGAVL